MPLSTVEIFYWQLGFQDIQFEDTYLFLILTNENLLYILQR